MSRKIRSEHYEGLSLIETLITLVIVGIIIIIISSTLAALIKASAISAARTISREESEFVLELLEKEIENSKSEDINVYYFDPGTINKGQNNNTYVNINNAVVTHLPPYSVTFPVDIPVNQVAQKGNEIHIRPISSDSWVCVGLYEYYDPNFDKDIGVLVKNVVPGSYYPDPKQTQDCMVYGDNRIFLTSEEIDVENFEVTHYETQGDNETILIDLTIQPVHWIPGPSSRYEPEYVRQLIVTTEKLTL